MIAWLVALLVGAAAAAIQYGIAGAPSAAVRAGLGLLRAVAIALLLALLLDAPLGRPRIPTPAVYVDASQSMTRGDSRAAIWRAAWDSAVAHERDSVFAFGDTVRRAVRDSVPAMPTSRARSVVDHTMTSGRPAIVITDGELTDSSTLDALPSGSRVIVLSRPAQRDAAIANVELPRAVVEGDSLAARITLTAGNGGASAGTVVLMQDRQLLGRWPLDSMSPQSERQIDVRVRTQGGANGLSVLRAIVSSAGDAEARNDTLAATLEVSRAAAAVFVSTSPDQDARFAIAVLRGTLALPTRGFFRVAPGRWVREGTLAPTTEAEVRQALRDAPVAILHGDSLIFGPPRSATFGPLALIAPSDDEGEWYPTATPVSPLSGALAAIPLDSLPPIAAGAAATGDWVGLEVRRGREATRRPIVVGRERPRRSVVVSGSGFWRWRFRGGASADAYAALLGGIFDWLAAERADKRAAVPEDAVLREGQRVRWRRSSGADTVVRAVVTARRSGARSDTLVLRFPSGAAVAETPALPRGEYDVATAGGQARLVVNPSTELLPSRATVVSGAVGHRVAGDAAPRARRFGWLFVVAVVLLCVEWVLRRRVGLR